MTVLQKIFSAIVIVLAINFIAIAVAAALLAQKAGLDREKVQAVREILFPPPDPDESDPADSAAATQIPEPTPMEQLMALLDAQSGKPTEERVEDLQQTFDGRTVALTRARRELDDLQRQLDIASRRLLEQRTAFESSRQEWEQAVVDAAERSRDKGFADALQLYSQLPARQTKDIFLQLEEEVVLQFLQAMDPQPAAKVLKEYKTDAEIQKLRSLLEEMRKGDPVANAFVPAGS